MDQIGDFFSTVGGYLGTGGVMLAAGVILLIASRNALPENKRVMKWIGIPLAGCGGCLVIAPIIVVLALVGLGFMILCGSGC